MLYDNEEVLKALKEALKVLFINPAMSHIIVNNSINQVYMSATEYLLKGNKKDSQTRLGAAAKRSSTDKSVWQKGFLHPCCHNTRKKGAVSLFLLKLQRYYDSFKGF